MIWKAFAMAVRHIARNGMRSLLTMLGVLIGVAAVIAMVSLGRGATRSVQEDLQSLGHNMLFVVPGTESRGTTATMFDTRPFRAEDAHAALREVPGLAAVAPVANRGMVAVAGDARWRTTVTGSDGEYLRALGWVVASGREISDGELRSGAAVCVLGDRVRAELFAPDDAVGQAIRLGNLSCRVIATLRPKGHSTLGMDQDDFVLVPLALFQRRISGNSHVGMLFVSAAPGVSTEQVKLDLEALFRQRRHIHPGELADFIVRDMKEVEAMVGGITAVLTSLLAAIAAVSLLVGGIGIMNIMLVAVTERTREIGIRLAIGARAREVLLQFLVEAAALSALGGLAGMCLGLTSSYLVTRRLGLPFVFDPSAVLLAFGFAALVGVVFGFFPARKAARLQPIDALRYE